MSVNELISVDFGPDVEKDLNKYVHDNVTKLKATWRNLHEEKVREWRRLYKGQPRDKVRNFPWKNASNVVIQLIGENCDIVRARVLGTIFEVMPLWVTELLGDWTMEEQGGEQQEAVHQALNYCGLEPNELDLYRVESQGIDETVKFGTVVYKLPWIKDVEAEAIGIVDGKLQVKEFTKYEGPRPEKIEFEDWAASLDSSTLEDCAFKYHKVVLTRQKLEERFFLGFYKLTSEEKEKFLNNPDRTGPTAEVQEKQALRNLDAQQGYNAAEWDIHECWFPYFHNGKKYRIIYSYHYPSKTKLRAIFNFYPKNEEPWELSRFGYTDDGLLGYGMCEMLEHYQDEVSTAHNQRADNRTLANTSIARVSGSSKLDSIFSLYPMAMIPADKDEFEIMQLGANYPTSVPEEQLTIGLAKARAGTEDPGQQMAGGGTQNAKKGVYSAMGTFSVMQAGNRRININITDMRYTHLKLGRKFLNQYAHFGFGERVRLFGAKEKYLQLAFENIRKGRLGLPIKAATASVNKELEKQNDMLLTQVMQRHHMGIAQILQSVSNPMMPEEIKSFLVGWIDSSSVLMARILRNFGHEDLSRLLPERRLLEKMNNGQQNMGGNQAGAEGSNGGNTGQQAVEQTSIPAQEGSSGLAVAPGGSGVSSVPIQ